MLQYRHRRYTSHLVQNIFHDGQESRRSTSVETPLLAEGVVVVVEVQHNVFLVRQPFYSSVGIVTTQPVLFLVALRHPEPEVHRQEPGEKQRQMLWCKCCYEYRCYCCDAGCVFYKNDTYTRTYNTRTVVCIYKYASCGCIDSRSSSNMGCDCECVGLGKGSRC